MSQLALIVRASKLLRGKKRGKELMLIGFSLIALSSYLHPSYVVAFDSTTVVILLGIFTFVYGLASLANEKECGRRSTEQECSRRRKRAKSTTKRDNFLSKRQYRSSERQIRRHKS